MARAQIALPPADQPGRPRDLQLLPDELPRAPVRPELLLPVVPPARAPEAGSLATRPELLLRALRFEGNTVFSAPELQEGVAGYLGTLVGAAELEAIRLAITRQYILAGYINSGAVIPDQEVDDGELRVLVIEGRLTGIDIVGQHRFRPGYLRDRLARSAEPVLNVNRLQEQMQLLLQDPQIERLSGELAPGSQPGEARLRVDVTGGPVYFAGFAYGNERSPVVGANQVEAFGGTRNLFGAGEVITLRGAKTEGLDDGQFSVVMPLHASGTQVQFRLAKTRSRIVEAPLDQLDISAESSGFDLALSQPLIATLARSLIATATVSNRRTRNYFLGQPSVFVPGAPDGVTTVSALRLGLDWVGRSTERVVALRGLVSYGLDAMGASVASAPGIADSRFTSALVQGQWIERLGTRGTLVARAENQQANDSLLGPERYAFGGMDSVRGYRKDVQIRDSGWFSSIEYRHLVGHVRLPGQRAQGSTEGALQLAVFADAGRGRLRNDPAPAPGYLSSVGVGARWEPYAGVQLQIYYGEALHPVRTPTSTLADNGWHLRLTYVTSF